ncbi:hypothetical protein ACGO3R_06015 [Lactococcus lactis]
MKKVKAPAVCKKELKEHQKTFKTNKIITLFRVIFVFPGKNAISSQKTQFRHKNNEIMQKRLYAKMKRFTIEI